MRSDISPVELTRKLLAFNTINPPGLEKRCAEYVGKILDDAGFTVQYHEFAPGRTSLVARYQASYAKLPLCLTGHLDVVPLGTAKWTKDPFRGERDGDKLYGRGSSDMKGGVAAMVIAALKSVELNPHGTNIVLVLTAGEEVQCAGSKHLAELDILRNAGAIIVGEPTSNEAWLGHKGIMWMQGSAKGVAGHASTPNYGDNAIYKVTSAIEKLRQYNFEDKSHPLLGTATLSVGTISGGLNFNLIPDSANFSLDVRTIPNQPNEEVFENLQKLFGEEITLKKLYSGKGIATDESDPWVQSVYDSMERLGGTRPTAKAGTFFTDASSLTPAMGNPPTIVLGPGEPSKAHKTDEYCLISKIDEAIVLYTDIIDQWSRSK